VRACKRLTLSPCEISIGTGNLDCNPAVSRPDSLSAVRRQAETVWRSEQATCEWAMSVKPLRLHGSFARDVTKYSSLPREPQMRSCNTNSDIEGPFAPPSDPALLRLLLRH
jgi:hypothetical protein